MKTNNPKEKELIFYEDLPEKKKVERLERSLRVLIATLEFQKEKLKKYKNSKITEKEIGFGYFYETFSNTLDNIRFALNLGKGKYKYFNVYPTRVVCENVFRIEYYINQNIKIQNEISFYELTRIMKRFYDVDNDDTFKKSYDGMVKDFGEKDKIYPEITDQKAYKDPFPSIENLMKTSKLLNSKNFYIHYRFLSESQHSKLLSIFVSKDQNSQYRRDIFYLNLFSKWLLRLVDIHIKNETKKEVDSAIINSEKILNLKILSKELS